VLCCYVERQRRGWVQVRPSEDSLHNDATVAGSRYWAPCCDSFRCWSGSSGHSKGRFRDIKLQYGRFLSNSSSNIARVIPAGSSQPFSVPVKIMLQDSEWSVHDYYQEEALHDVPSIVRVCDRKENAQLDRPVRNEVLTPENVSQQLLPNSAVSAAGGLAYYLEREPHEDTSHDLSRFLVSAPPSGSSNAVAFLSQRRPSARGPACSSDFEAYSPRRQVELLMSRSAKTHDTDIEIVP
jgi:hypothetical protein